MSSVVVVSRPSAPGLHRLEAVVGLLGAARVHGVLVGTPRRWPRQLDHYQGPLCRQLRAESRLVLVPHDARLALEGLTPDSLPVSLLAAISPVFEGLRGTLR